MYSIASWSPSQSEPLIVSYMCQSQLSSAMLPSDAPMPPCAATVCERVGNTLDSTATDRPASASCSDARMPAPPAPTTIASNLRTGNVIADPHAVADRRCAAPGRTMICVRRPRRSRAPPQDRDQPRACTISVSTVQHFERQAQRRRLDVVHPDVAHADPRVPEQRQARRGTSRAGTRRCANSAFQAA